MTPTPKLRFVERTLAYPQAKTIRVLQQWWEQKQWSHDTEIVIAGEWRDVPLEEET